MTYKSKYLKYKNKCIILKDKLNNIIKKIKLISMGNNNDNNYDNDNNDNDYTNNLVGTNTDFIYEILDKIIDGIE